MSNANSISICGEQLNTRDVRTRTPPPPPPRGGSGGELPRRADPDAALRLQGCMHATDPTKPWLLSLECPRWVHAFATNPSPAIGDARTRLEEPCCGAPRKELAGAGGRWFPMYDIECYATVC